MWLVNDYHIKKSPITTSVVEIGDKITMLQGCLVGLRPTLSVIVRHLQLLSVIV